MSFQRAQVYPQQRFDSKDFNGTNDLAFSNLALALRYAIQPNGGLIKGGAVTATSPASKAVDVAPLFAINDNNEMMVLEATDTKAIGDNTSGNPRIDLVSVGYSDVDDIQESRQFWDQTGGFAFPQNVDTRKTTTATVVVTQGVPAASPSVPATPAGHVALAQIAVEDGFTAITDGDIITYETTTGLIAGVADWGANPINHAFPADFVSDPLWSVATPQGRTTFMMIQLNWAAGNEQQQPIYMIIEDADSSEPIGGALGTHPVSQGLQQSIVVGALIGPSAGMRRYRLRIKRYGFDEYRTLASSVALWKYVIGVEPIVPLNWYFVLTL
jgi:hypothetical protein